MLRPDFPLATSKVITDSPNNPFYVRPASAQSRADSVATTVQLTETTCPASPINVDAVSEDELIDVVTADTESNISAAAVVATVADSQLPAVRSGSGSVSGYSTVSETFPVHTTALSDIPSGGLVTMGIPGITLYQPVTLPHLREWPPVLQSPNNPFDVSYRAPSTGTESTVRPRFVGFSSSPPLLPQAGLPGRPAHHPTLDGTVDDLGLLPEDLGEVLDEPSTLGPQPPLVSAGTMARPHSPSSIGIFKEDATVAAAYPPMSDTFEQEYALAAAREHAQDIFREPADLAAGEAKVNAVENQECRWTDTSANSSHVSAAALPHDKVVESNLGAGAADVPPRPATLADSTTASGTAARSATRPATVEGPHFSATSTLVNVSRCPSTTADDPHAPALLPTAAPGQPSTWADIPYLRLPVSFPPIIDDAGNNPFWVPHRPARTEIASRPS
ncbi:hypothetical protein IWQ60_000823 [Tieghemiomyces parasiticus]|uniref:Uncharacterized protein n=1 Tax=Tieghemiomyces parasiticus TaxID=78921 RepID=A0A9W8E2F1_9FUNG|nr:hypothetical protein IWQ60_000823 [Tieghemiomyces parasiticus]